MLFLASLFGLPSVPSGGDVGDVFGAGLGLRWRLGRCVSLQLLVFTARGEGRHGRPPQFASCRGSGLVRREGIGGDMWRAARWPWIPAELPCRAQEERVVEELWLEMSSWLRSDGGAVCFRREAKEQQRGTPRTANRRPRMWTGEIEHMFRNQE